MILFSLPLISLPCQKFPLLIPASSLFLDSWFPNPFLLETRRKQQKIFAFSSSTRLQQYPLFLNHQYPKLQGSWGGSISNFKEDSYASWYLRILWKGQNCFCLSPTISFLFWNVLQPSPPAQQEEPIEPALPCRGRTLLHIHRRRQSNSDSWDAAGIYQQRDLHFNRWEKQGEEEKK